MQAVEGNLRISLSENMNGDMEISIKDDTVFVTINQKRIFAVLYNMENVLGAINSALKSTLKQHLLRMMKDEEAR